MAKRAQGTRVFLNGEDISSLVLAASLPRASGDIEKVHLTVTVDRLTVDKDGVLEIHINEEGY